MTESGLPKEATHQVPGVGLTNQDTGSWVKESLEIARELIRAGCPVTVARRAFYPGTREWDPLGGRGGTGYWLPSAWEQIEANEAHLDHWRPGDALLMVTGHAADGLDCDPRNGGEASAAELEAEGIMPRGTGLQETPSGGWHRLITPLGVPKMGGVRPGIDVQSGTSDGTGRGFLFIAPTVRVSKTSGEVGRYRWAEPPKVETLAEDRSGEGLAAEVLAQRTKTKEPTKPKPREPADPTLGRAKLEGYAEAVAAGGTRHGSMIAAQLALVKLGDDAGLEALRAAFLADVDGEVGRAPEQEWASALEGARAIVAADPAPEAEPEVATSRRVDLRPYLDGTYVPPTPSVGAARDDGRQILYPGRWHTVIALTAAGKSWFALWHAYAVLQAGGTVVYLHFEEASPALMLGRLEALGVAPETIETRFAWLDCSTGWKPRQYEAELDRLGEPPGLVTLDGINAACSAHGWPVNDPDGVGSYRAAFVLPATSRGVAVLSLGHPPKAPDRQTERHGFGSTAWLDEADGVGFRLEASRTPIRRGHRGASRLYSVKDRDGQVERHGEPVANRDGWWYMGAFMLDDSGLGLRTTAGLSVPATAETPTEPIDALAESVVAYLKAHGERFETKAELKEGLRSTKVRHDDRDLGPALLRLVDAGRLEWPPATSGRARPGWLPSTAVPSDP